MSDEQEKQDEERKQTVARLQSEGNEIRLAIADVFISWGALESALAVLLGAMLRTDSDIAFTVYFSSNNTENRVRLIENAIRHVRIPQGIDWEEFRKCFDALCGKIHKAKDARNKIAHGALMTMYVNGKNHMRFAKPIFDFSDKQPSKSGPKQIPGRSANDIRQMAEKIGKCEALIGDFSELLVLQTGTLDAWRDKFLQLSKNLIPPNLLPPDGQIPPESSDQH